MSTIINSPNGGLAKGNVGNANDFVGNPTDDYIYTSFGSKIFGSFGNDYIDGGSTGTISDGASTIDYSLLTGAATTLTAFSVNLATGIATFTVGASSYTQSLKNIDNVYGVTGKSGINTFTGNSNNNIFGADGLSDTFVGGGGFDAVDFSSEKSGVTVDLSKGTAKIGTISDKLTGISAVYGSTSASNTMTGDANNNVFLTGGKGDIVIGGGGIDTCAYKPSSSNILANAASYSIGVTTSNQIYVGLAINPTVNVDILTNIQRLQFTDKNLAFDINGSAGTLTGNAGIVEKILGAVFGQDSLQNQQYIGIGLSYLDKGTTYSQLVNLALVAQGLSTPSDVITKVWNNILGADPTQSQILNIISSGISMNAFVMQAADSVFNTSHIDVVGIQKHGLAYTPGIIY